MRPSSRKAVTLYMKHLAVAWPGITIGSMVIGALPGLTALFDVPNSAPIFGGWLIAGAALGYSLNRADRVRVACFVFLPALALFAVDFWASLHQPVGGGWASVWAMYFSKNCSNSECLGEGLMTAPLYASMAYSLAAWAALWRGSGRKASNAAQQART